MKSQVPVCRQKSPEGNLDENPLDCSDPVNFGDASCQQPLPCEYVPTQDLTDTIRVVVPLMQDAFKKILPLGYHSYIEFDNTGVQNKVKFLNAGNNSTLTSSEIYKALVFIINSDVNSNVRLSKIWVGLTNEHPNDPNHPHLFHMSGQYLDAITVAPAKDPITNAPVTEIRTKAIFSLTLPKTAVSNDFHIL